MELGIRGRTALVCAGSKGLGRACAEALAAEGVDIVLNARNEITLRQAAETIEDTYRVKVVQVAADVGTEAGRAALLDACVAPDILVNNAGGPSSGNFQTWTESDWHNALAANLRAPAALIAAVIDGMAARGFGRIVNITAAAVRHPIDTLGLSSMARGGLHGLVSTLVRGVAANNVTINNILPGPFKTDRLVNNLAYQAQLRGRTLEERVAERLAETPARRFGDPQELGRLCAFLCSAHAGYISGQSILIDGGAHPQIV